MLVVRGALLAAQALVRLSSDPGKKLLGDLGSLAARINWAALIPS